MIFYFSGFTSGADPEREMGEAATIMMSFYAAIAANKNGLDKKKTLKPDKRFQLVHDARKKKHVQGK